MIECARSPTRLAPPRFRLSTAFPGSLSNFVITPDTPAPRRLALPEGTAPVGVALLIAGVATYAFFIVGTEALGGKAQFEPIATMWFATFSLAPGFFLPLEQELGRALSHRRATGEGGLPVVRRIIGLGSIITVIVLAAMAIASPVITRRLFDGDWWMTAALATAFLAYAPAHLARGVSAGTGRFRIYAIVMGSDGVIRIAACLILFALGVNEPAPYAFAVALSPLVAIIAVGTRGHLRTQPGPVSTWQEVTQNLGWLLIGTVFAAGLLNAGPVALKLLADAGQDAHVASFGYGVLLARIPLFLFQAVQAALLPRLSRLAAMGEWVDFRHGLTRLLQLVVIVGVVGTTGAYLLGPFIIRRVFDAELTGATLAWLALSSALYMAGLATSQAVIALRGNARVALGWATGAAAFVLGTWLGSDDLFRRIEIALVLSSLASLIVFAAALRSKLHAATR